MLEATTPSRNQDQGQLLENCLEISASHLPKKDPPLLVIKKVIGSPHQRVCPTVTESTVLMGPPRIGHIHEQFVLREVKSPKGETVPESLNGLQKDSFKKQG